MTPVRLTVGFMPLLDCAPLVVAHELGFAAREGLDLALVRETSWANIRDRVIVGHFSAAQMLGPMVVASSLGIGHLKVPMIAPITLGLGGNAITVGTSLWDEMAAAGAAPGASPGMQGAALRAVVQSRAAAGLPPLTFAMVYPFSCHNYELRYWLAACGIDPDEDVRLVVIPPPLLVDALREGQVQGFCVGEPWNSLAVAAGVGRIVLPASAIWRLAPEKVLGCRADWAAAHPSELAALVRAVRKAAVWCDDPGHHVELAKLLAEPRHVGTPAEVLLQGLSGALPLAPTGAAIPIADFHEFAHRSATLPRVGHALWFYSQMVRWGQVEAADAHAAAARATYRPDLYEAALSGHETEMSEPEQSDPHAFFDGIEFHADSVAAYLAALPRPAVGDTVLP
jgi:two-component system, oxyanion-binding sensor